MGRRNRNDGLADAVIALTARLPWWAGVALAGASYLVLHRMAATPPVAAPSPGQVAELVQGMLLHSLASVGQYVLPMLFLVGAGVSAFQRRKADRLHADAASGAPAIARMAWVDFETLTAEYFRHRGFAVAPRTRGGADGGVDVELTKAGDLYLVQCKHWRAQKVGVETVRELYGVVSARRAAGGFVLTSGRFTDAAKQFAQGREIELIDGPDLERAVQQQRRKADRASASEHRTPAPPAGAVDSSSSTTPLATSALPSAFPSCPVCAAPMTLRLARRGAQAGTHFWGCTRYTAGCRGTRTVDTKVPPK